MNKQLVAAFFLLIASAVAVPAQRSIEEAAKSARDKFSDVKNRSIELERMKRDAARRPANGDSVPGFPAIKEDFEEIQKITVGVSELIAGKSPINYAAVLKLVSELNRRALRLKSNLFLAEVEQKKNKRKSDAEAPDIQTLVRTLDKSVISFVHSSLFQNVKLVNSDDSFDAQNDLETVIETSFLIREKAKKLKKEHFPK